MTSESISSSYRDADARWRSIVADLVFWALVGSIVAALSRPLGEWWRLPQPALLAGGVVFAAVGAGLLFGLSRVRPTPRRLVWSFGLSNLVLAPVAWVAAVQGWLPVSAAGNWSLTIAGAAALALGVWQLNTLRRS